MASRDRAKTKKTEIEKTLAQQTALVREMARFPEMNPGPVLRVDRDGIILLSNSEARLVFGNELVSKNWKEVCPGMNNESWNTILSSKKVFPFEAYVEKRCFVFNHRLDTATNFVFVYGTDITVNKENEKKLEEQRAEMKEMARFPEMNPGPVLRIDREGLILLSNSQARLVFGDELVSKNWKEVCPGMNNETWTTILLSEKVFPFEAYVEERCFVFNHRLDSATDYVFVYGTDITVNKQNEKKLEEQRAEMKELARFPDMNPGPVIRTDFKGIIILSNVAAQNVFEKNITGDCWVNVCPRLTQELWDEILLSDKVFPFETVIGEKEFVFNHRTDSQSSLVFIYGTDVTIQKLAERQLRHSEKMASLGELTAGIAHEIQNPLNFVNNFSDVNKELVDELKNELATGNVHSDSYRKANEIADDIKANEEKISHHGKRADAIVKGMLQHSRASSGIKEPTDINALVDEYLRLAFHGLRAKDKSFNAIMKTDFDEGIGKVNIIPQDIGRVILNLINNAFYAVTEKKKQLGDYYEPTVSVSTKKEKDKVEIEVKDNGNGITEKVLDKIFQPFFTTKPTGQGTGLGLSLAYDIVKAHGGELKVETKEGEGATFIVVLSK